MTAGDAGRLEVGAGVLSFQASYTRPRPLSTIYREAIEEATWAEGLGYDSFWIGEHHYEWDRYNSALMPVAAHLAAATQRIHIGTSVLLLPFQGVDRMAGSVAAFQSMAPARLKLGVALGYRPIEYEAAGIDMRTRGRLMDEMLEVMVDGRHSELFANTELWMGGSTDAVVRRSARFGTSLLLGYPDAVELRRIRALWESQLRASPSFVPRLGVIREVWVDRDQRRIDYVRGRLTEMWRYYADFPVDHWASRAASEKRGRNAEELTSYAIVGSPEEVVDALAPLVGAGLDLIVMRVRYGDGMEIELVKDCLALLADEVVPHLRRVPR